MFYKNCTSHTINFLDANGRRIEFPPSGEVARVETIEVPAYTLEAMPVIRREFGKVFLPEPPCEEIDGSPIEGFLIVSSLVLEAARQQDKAEHLLAPDTGPTAIRDDKGQVVAVRRWVCG